jgi:hypothetical protein
VLSFLDVAHARSQKEESYFLVADFESCK